MPGTRGNPRQNLVAPWVNLAIEAIELPYDRAATLTVEQYTPHILVPRPCPVVLWTWVILLVIRVLSYVGVHLPRRPVHLTTHFRPP